MEIKEIGRKLVSLCREGRNRDAIDELYADTVVSVEADTPPGEDRAVEGIEAVRKKNEWWEESHEVHTVQVDGPFTHGDDKFAAVFDIEATYLPDDEKHHLQEVAVYTVANGRIVREEFFYAL